MELDVNMKEINIDWKISKVVKDKLRRVKIGYRAEMLLRLVVRKYLR